MGTRRGARRPSATAGFSCHPVTAPSAGPTQDRRRVLRRGRTGSRRRRSPSIGKRVLPHRSGPAPVDQLSVQAIRDLHGSRMTSSLYRIGRGPNPPGLGLATSSSVLVARSAIERTGDAPTVERKELVGPKGVPDVPIW